MNIISLKDALKSSTQEQVASLLGVTQGAIWQATQNSREIFIVEDDGKHFAIEIKPALKTKADLKKIRSKVVGQL